MAKKEKINLTHSKELEDIDADLNAAMQSLDSKNQEIDDLLKGFDPPKPGQKDDLFETAEGSPKPEQS